MKKDFLDELIDELINLKQGRKRVSIPIPPAPHEVFEVVVGVAKKHKITADEMGCFLAFRNPTKSDIEIINELEKEEKEEN